MSVSIEVARSNSALTWMSVSIEVARSNPALTWMSVSIDRGDKVKQLSLNWDVCFYRGGKVKLTIILDVCFYI